MTTDSRRLLPKFCVLALRGLVGLALSAPGLGFAAAPPAPAAHCLSEIKGFDARLQKEGYWMHGSSYGFGYPMFDYGYGFGYGGDRMGMMDAQQSSGYWRARPGYEVRSLLTAATILAERGDEASCEAVLTNTREAYMAYAADLANGKIPHADVSGWRQRQIAAAVPVSTSNTAFRSDQLVGAEVVSADGTDLGSVHDIVASPNDSKLTFLVIARGGFLGFDQSYVPVPWADFKVAPGARLLVLASSKAILEGAPQVKDDQFARTGDFAAQSSKVAAYWTAHLTP